MERKEYKLKVAKAKASISDVIILKLEVSIDHFNHKEVMDIIKLLQNGNATILDLDANEYKLMAETLSVGRNNIKHTNDYERFLAFNVIYMSKEKEITDFDAWFKRLENKELIIRQ